MTPTKGSEMRLISSTRRRSKNLPVYPAAHEDKPMASTKDFTDYVCDQIRDAGDISSRKMFGEYAVYCDGKVVALICDDQVFVKKTTAAAMLLGDNAEEAPPYDGAKPHFLITDLDDQEFMTGLMRAICDELPPPKPKKARKPRKKC